MCTGNFYAPGRPPVGTMCVKNGGKICQIESGRWGKSYCFTEADGSNWGGECIPCSGIIETQEGEYNQVLFTLRVVGLNIYLPGLIK